MRQVPFSQDTCADMDASGAIGERGQGAAELTYQIGDLLPAANVRGIQHGPDINPIWHGLKVRSGLEARTRTNLKNRAVTAFFPAKEITRHIRGKAVHIEKPEVYGIIFARFTRQPQWDNLIRREGLVLGVFCSNGKPIEIGEEVISYMRGMTTEHQRLIAEQEAMERARLDALRPKAGDTAYWCDGPLKGTGFAVNVESIEGGDVVFEFLSGGRGRTTINMLARAA